VAGPGPAAKAGPLLLAGGAEFDERMAPADRALLALIGRPSPRLAVLPTANADHPEAAAANGVAHFRSLGVEAEAVMITSRARAGDPALARQLALADCFYLAGGDPLRLLEVLRASLAWETLLQRWREGAGLGGSSAGAMALCQAVYLRRQWADGLGVVPGTAALPHFNLRRPDSVERVRARVSERDVIGLGIDESTACIWSAGAWRAAGQGQVHLLARDGVRTYTAGEAISGLAQPAIPA